ncbi:hypothetical protein [Sorangium sp. So ce854]|uniref:hypothetical protein n=1 Tax=Sorangium sp. So ce854 TaxID=3133322 RepID=UPI003F63B661
MLLLPAMACENYPDIAGKATVKLGGETLVLDSGDDGKHFVMTGDLWSTACYPEDSSLAMVLQRAHEGDPPITMIRLAVKRTWENGDPAPNVTAELRRELYDGFCDVVATSGSKRHDVEFSAADCELQRGYDGLAAWLVSASFQVKECEDE